MRTLRVVSIEDAQDKTGVAYKKVGFEAITKDGNIEVLTNDGVRYRNLWAERKLENGTIKADPLFSKVKVGAVVAGHVETLPTTPYELNERMVSTHTGVFFSNENAITVANRNLRSNNANVIDLSTGEIYGATAAQDNTPELNTSKITSPVEA